MANKKQLEILKQGVDVWNDWANNNDVIVFEGEEIDLRGADLKDYFLKNVNFVRADLGGANLDSADLTGANLFSANLTGANLRGAKLIGAQFRQLSANETILIGADLSKANFIDVEMTHANLDGAILVNANLYAAVFEQVNLRNADFGGSKAYALRFTDAFLTNANLKGADFSHVTFNKTDLSFSTLEGATFTNVSFTDTALDYARMGYTNLLDLDFSEAKRLDTVIHIGKSNISTNTLFSCKGKIPEAFLRGCGLSDWEIESAKLYNPDLSNEEINEILYRVHDLRARRPVQISPLFISYSHKDSAFVDRVEKSLDERGIRFWRDIHSSTSGPLEKQIDRAISQNPTVLIILSENSTKSDWVQHEVRRAREIEKDIGRHVLCPVRLDDSFFSSSWPERIKEQVKEYNILDFSKWNDDEKFRGMFTRLIDGLSLFYKKDEDK